MEFDRREAQVKTSGDLVTDRKINAYVRDVVCRLAGPYCSDVRVYVVQIPHFNAMMSPNGMMEIWSGLLLRAQNGAQLAYVLGHELGHYLRRHSLQQWRDVRTKANLVAFFQVMTAGAGYGFVGEIARMAALASVLAFSRDQEREADEIGFDFMVNAGYDPREAAKIWEAIIREREAAKEPGSWIFFNTHPPTQERIETLKVLAGKVTREGRSGTAEREAFLEATLPLRGSLLRDELRLREFARSQVVLESLVEGGADLGEIDFFQGELYRLRGEKKDEESAIRAYEKALQQPNAPSEAHRALGFLALKRGEKEKAKASLHRYLEASPDADDREMIRSYLQQIP
jgi:predicted Zn-dependent protease